MKSETIYTIIIAAMAAVGGYFIAPGRELALADLDRKIGFARFNLDQLQVGRDAFMGMLKAALERDE